MENFVGKSDVALEALNTYSALASNLGWPPGFAPSKIRTNLGNSELLFLYKEYSSPEVNEYRQVFGNIVLHVRKD